MSEKDCTRMDLFLGSYGYPPQEHPDHPPTIERWAGEWIEDQLREKSRLELRTSWACGQLIIIADMVSSRGHDVIAGQLLKLRTKLTELLKHEEAKP